MTENSIIKLSETTLARLIAVHGRDATCREAIVGTDDASGQWLIDTRHAAWVASNPKPSSPVAHPAEKKIAYVPKEQWPRWARDVAEDPHREREDVGVGDTIEKILGDGGMAAKVILATLGVPCGCAQRKAEYNVLYSYKKHGA